MIHNKKEAGHIVTASAIISKIIIIIVTVELAIMALMANYLHHLAPVNEALLDSLLLAILSTPFIYFWIIKPYVVGRDHAEKELSRMAYHDHLTSLPNRRLLSEYLSKYLSICKRHKIFGALLLIDLNDFKAINDTYGHDTGDFVLQETARRLSSVIRSEDIVSRMGGDEFIVVLHSLGDSEELATANAKTVSEKLQDAMQDIIEFNHQQLQIKASIGVRILDAEHSGVDAILKEADAAMYHAKKNRITNDAYIFCEAAA
ncbi:MAG: GGDEF domain-containing protein [Gammaproteobacteria bacterium]|nr:GGDEF domain-containing protein [Gammaproteobacteria bacterium]MCW8922618.1 GGDEF domain-containing protein [Gammaproteobacteria bacterium]